MSPPFSQPSLLAQRLCRSFHGQPVLDGIDLAVEAGEIVALRGANGAGKTTLLRCLAGRLTPTAGNVWWLGEAPRRRPELHSRIGLAGHETGLYLELTARENLLLAARLQGLPQPLERVQEQLTAFGLAARGHVPAERLSRGQRQRLSLARALIHDPPIVLLDEPFAGLDFDHVAAVEAWLADLRDRGRAILLSSHDAEQCRRLADRQIVLENGRLREVDASCPLGWARSA